ncbi:hypothetical protein D3C75_761530 [compost metagenome]
MFHLSLLELQLRDRSFQGDDLIQYSLSLDGDIYRARAGLICIQLAFGLFELFAHVR